MATLSPVIVPGKALSDGRHKIRIAVSHNGQTRYIVTDIVISSSREFKNGIIVRRGDSSMLNSKLRGLLQRYQTVIDETDYSNSLSCPELIYVLKHSGEKKNRSLKSIYDEYIFTSSAKESSKYIYKTYWSTIKKFINENMLIQSVDHTLVLGLERYLRNSGIREYTLRNRMSFFRSILVFAKRYGYVQYQIDPFVGYKMPNNCVRDAWLTVEDIKRIRDIEIKSIPLSKARDLFMLSYYLGGINIADIVEIDFSKQTDRLKYIRKKTNRKKKINKYVEFDIPQEAKDIIKKYVKNDGTLKFNYFDIAFYIKKLKELVGCDEMVFYSARKSFSQHAFCLGINTSVIDYILGHKVDKSDSSLFYYLYVTPEMATAAVRQVLDNLK